jgi:hypothetical protein
MNKKGYWGIAFYEPKFEENIGTAVRSAHCFGADFIAVIGKRYKRTPADTMASHRHMPIFEYQDLDDFIKHLPVECELVPDSPRSRSAPDSPTRVPHPASGHTGMRVRIELAYHRGKAHSHRSCRYSGQPIGGVVRVSMAHDR